MWLDELKRERDFWDLVRDSGTNVDLWGVFVAFLTDEHPIFEDVEFTLRPIERSIIERSILDEIKMGDQVLSRSPT